MQARTIRLILFFMAILAVIVYLGFVYSRGLVGDRPGLVYFYVKT